MCTARLPEPGGHCMEEAIELYIGTLSKDEIKESLSKEIMSTALEVRVA